MRYGPCFAGNLKNLVFSDQGTKHCGSALGPDTTSGPAATAVATPDKRLAMSVETSTAKRCERHATVISVLPATHVRPQTRLGLSALAPVRSNYLCDFAGNRLATRRRTLCLTAQRTASQRACRLRHMTRVAETTSPAQTTVLRVLSP